MIRSPRLLVFLGIVFVGLGALVLLGGYYLVFPGGAREEPAQVATEVVPTNEVTIYVAARDVQRGNSFTAEDFRPLKLADSVPGGAIQDATAIEGKVALVDFLSGQIITESSLSSNPADAGLAALIPPGKRAVAISVSDEIAVGNFIQPGDLVDLQLVLRQEVLVGRNGGGDEDQSEANVLLQDLKVLTVGPVISRKDEDSDETRRIRHVTLEVTPEQANALALARQLGSYYLSLRNPEDREPVDAPSVVVGDLRGRQRPEPVQVAVEEPAPAPAPVIAPELPRYRTVELFVGPQKTTVKLEKGR